MRYGLPFSCIWLSDITNLVQQSKNLSDKKLSIHYLCHFPGAEEQVFKEFVLFSDSRVKLSKYSEKIEALVAPVIPKRDKKCSKLVTFYYIFF